MFREGYQQEKMRRHFESNDLKGTRARLPSCPDMKLHDHVSRFHNRN
jgi:hypothetical protein